MEQIIQSILQHEVHFHFANSWWHGGQNVNKRKTKAELYFNIQDSQYLTPEQKQRLIDLAGNRIHHEEKILIMTCQEERLQEANKKKVINHFRELLMEALIEPVKRIPTNIPEREFEARIMDKKFQAQKKQNRKKPNIADSL